MEWNSGTLIETSMGVLRRLLGWSLDKRKRIKYLPSSCDYNPNDNILSTRPHSNGLSIPLSLKRNASNSYVGGFISTRQ